MRESSIMRLGWLLVVGAMLVCSGCSQFGLSPKSPALFSGLEPDQTVEVFYTSKGCFHSDSVELVFSPGPTGLMVAGFDTAPRVDMKRMVEVRERVTLKPISITHQDAHRLDRLMEFYRGAKDGGCTTMDTIRVTKRAGKEVLSSESFEDASCATYDRKDLLIIPALVKRMEPAER
jgi:hypothetical protein